MSICMEWLVSRRSSALSNPSSRSRSRSTLVEIYSNRIHGFTLQDCMNDTNLYLHFLVAKCYLWGRVDHACKNGTNWFLTWAVRVKCQHCLGRCRLPASQRLTSAPFTFLFFRCMFLFVLCVPWHDVFLLPPCVFSCTAGVCHFTGLVYLSLCGLDAGNSGKYRYWWINNLASLIFFYFDDITEYDINMYAAKIKKNCQWTNVVNIQFEVRIVLFVVADGELRQGQTHVWASYSCRAHTTPLHVLCTSQTQPSTDLCAA